MATVAPTTPTAKPSYAELLARIAELEKQNAEKAAAPAPRLGITKVQKSEKGGVSVYGLGRWPVTLYASQWEVLATDSRKGFGMTKEQFDQCPIGKFISEHKAELSWKE